MNKVMRKMTINKMKIGDEVIWLQGIHKPMIIKKFSPCSEQWCRLMEKFTHYKDCERVRVLGTIDRCDYVICCKDIEVIKHESSKED